MISTTTPIELKSKGRFSLNVFKEDGSEVLEKRIKDSENVVTYGGAYNMFFSNQLRIGMNAVIGTGTTEILRSNTALGTTAYTSPSTSSASREGNEVDNGDGTSTLFLTRTIDFSLGGTPGTFSEVGLSVSGTLYAGQLIKDEFGTPTTITVLADEQLTVTYTLEMTIPTRGPGTAPIVGTGNVTTPEGTSTYNIYAQPYFRDYAIGSSDTTVRGTHAQFTFITSTTTYITHLTLSSFPATHNGTGTVTRNSGTITIVPSDFSSTDLKYISTFAQYASLSRDIPDADKYFPSGGFQTANFLLEFSPSLSKDDTRSLSFSLTATYTI